MVYYYVIMVSDIYIYIYYTTCTIRWHMILINVVYTTAIYSKNTILIYEPLLKCNIQYN